MRYTQNAFDKAEAVLAARRRDHDNEKSRREAYVYAEMPEIRPLIESISNTYFELVKIIAAHRDNAAQAADLVRENNLAAQKRISIMLNDLTGDPDYLDPPHICERCKDWGYVEGVRCDCMKELLRKFTAEEINSRSTIALRDFSEFRSDYYDEGDTRQRMEKLCTYLKEYCAHFPNGCRSMLFIGQTGLGKTFFSSCVAKEILQKGYSVVFGSVSDQLRQIEREHFGKTSGDDDTLEALINADLLIMDDLGSEFLTPFYESCIYNIINGRINLKKPTIVSTNLDRNEFNGRYNERICSRVFNEFTPVLFAGRDIRQQKAGRLYARKQV